MSRSGLACLVLFCVTALGCAEENLCVGDGPYEEPCTCTAPGVGETAEGYRDLDGDGFGTEGLRYFCGGGYASGAGDCDDGDPSLDESDRDGDGQTSCGGDCDDQSALVHSGAEEVCDGVDSDCDGQLGSDEADEDADGYLACAGDCDDTDPDVTPADLDGDGASGCDDPPDCDDTDASLHLGDADGDGYTPCDGDCDDTDASLHLDDADGDGSSPCDGDCDDTDPDLEGLDLDGDGYSTCDEDCDDDSMDLHPGDYDNDGYSPCDGDCHDLNDTLTPEDADGDGYSSCDEDCDDGDATTYPGAPELCDELDNDCDGTVPADEADGDGDGYLACADCDDADEHEFPEEETSSGWARQCAIWLEADTTDSEWYLHRVEQSDAVHDGSMLAVYFRTGYWLDEMSIGMAYTTDMTTWQMAGEVLTGTGDTGDWDGEGISNPSVVYDPTDLANPYKMYFSAKSNVTGLTHIGLATSSDGFTWERHTDGDDTVQVVPTGTMGDIDAMYAAAPHVWTEGTTYDMVYFCSDGLAAYLCMASSGDGGYTWEKWDPEPGVGDAPQPLLTAGEAGAWDEMMVAFPVVVDTGTAQTLLFAGSDGSGWRTGAAHLPFGLTEGVSRLVDLNPVLDVSSQAGRWDDTEVYPDDVWEDGGVFTLFYSGARTDAAFDGERVFSIGQATNQAPTIGLDGPIDPVTIAQGDELTFGGIVSDTDALDELLIVVASEVDGDVMLTSTADVDGNFSVVAPGGTFDEGGPYAVTVTVYDAGGLGDQTSVSLEVTP